MPSVVNEASTPRPSSAQLVRSACPLASRRLTVCVKRERDWLTAWASSLIRNCWPGASESVTSISYSARSRPASLRSASR